MPRIIEYPVAVRADGGYVLGVNAAGQTKRFVHSGSLDTLYSDDRVYYVRPDGNDANSGRGNTPGTAKATIAGAMATLNGIDFNGYIPQLLLYHDITYNETLSFNPVRPRSYLQVIGNNTTIQPSTGNAIECYRSSFVELQGSLTIGAPGTGGCGLYALGGFIYTASTTFLACDLAVMYCDQWGFIGVYQDITISGNSAYFAYCTTESEIDLAATTYTVSGTPAYSGAFVYSAYNSTIWRESGSFSGAATGVRYHAYGLGVIESSGGGASFFPGDTAGVAEQGGVYI